MKIFLEIYKSVPKNIDLKSFFGCISDVVSVGVKAASRRLL
jgi:hypothetical protein